MSITALTKGMASAYKRLTMQFPAQRWGSSSTIIQPPGIANYRRRSGDGRSNSIIAACIGWMQRTFPEAPVQVQERVRDTGKWAPLPGHSMVDLIEMPNDEYSGVVLWMATIADLFLSGNAYWLIDSSRNGRAVRLWYTPSTMLSPQWDSSGRSFITHYHYKPDFGIKPIRVEKRDLVHLRFGLDAESRLGISPLSTVIREAYTDDEAAMFTAALLKNLGVPGVVIIPGNADIEFEDDAMDATVAKFKDKFGGQNRGEPLILSAPATIQTLSFSPEQMSLRELRQIPEERISAALGTPAMIVGLGAGLERSTYNNIAEAREAVYENTILPLHRLLGADLRTQLLSRFEGLGGTRTRRVAFDVSNVRVLQEDRQRLAQEIRVLTASGVIKIKDAKNRLNEAGYNLDIDDVADDVYIRQLSTIEVPSGESRWDYVFGDLAEPAIPSGEASGPTDGGPGQDGGNIGERLDAALPASATSVTAKEFDELVSAYQEHRGLGLTSAAVHAAEVYELHQGFSQKQWAHIKQMGYNADAATTDAQRVFSRMFQQIASDVVANMRSVSVRRLAHANGHASKQEDWTEIAEAIAEGNRSVDEVLEDFNEKYLAPVLLVLWGSVANSTFRQVATDLGVSIPFSADSLVGSEIIREASTRVSIIDINRQTRGAVLQAILDAAASSESFEALSLRIAQYVEGAHLYPGIAAEHGADAARLHRARVIAETEVRHIQNFAASHAMEQSGLVDSLLIFDGPGCGWLFHDDPDIANNSVRSFVDFRATPLAHPRCVRAAAPIFKMEETDGGF